MPSNDIVAAGMSLADDQLLRESWGRSPEEVERITGIPAERAIARVKWLLQQRNAIYTQTEQEQFLFMDLIKTKNRLDAILGDENRAPDAKLYNVMVTTLRTIGQQLELLRSRNSKELEIVSNAQRRVLRELLGRSYYPAIEKMNELYPDLPEQFWSDFEHYYQEALRDEALDRDMNADH